MLPDQIKRQLSSHRKDTHLGAIRFAQDDVQELQILDIHARICRNAFIP